MKPPVTIRFICKSWPYAKGSPNDSVGEYRGVLYPRLVGGVRCWAAKGEARRLFDHGLKTSILDYLRRNSSRIHESDSFLSLALFLVGKRPEQANPVVMFVADDKAARKEAFDLVKESSIMASYPGFELGHTDLGKFMALGGEAIPIFTSTVGSVKAKCFRLFSQPSKTGEAPRSAAGGGVILWKGVPMFLTVNHFLEASTPTTSSTDREDDDCEITGLEGFDEDGDGEDDTAEVDATSRGSISDQSDIDSSSEEGLFARSSECTVVSVRAPDSPPQQASSTAVQYMRAGDVLLRSKDLDYALVKVAGDAGVQAILEIERPVELASFDDQVERYPRATSITTITPDGDCISGSLSGSVHHIRLPLAKDFKEVYIAKFPRPLRPGECGSWVRDARSGKLFGHIIAGDTTAGHAVIMPAHAVLRDVQPRLAKLELDSQLASSGPLPKPRGMIRKFPSAAPRMDVWHFFALGLAFSILHYAFYNALNGTTVGTVSTDETTIRLESALAFLARIALTATIWQAQQRWLWRLPKHGIEDPLLYHGLQGLIQGTDNAFHKRRLQARLCFITILAALTIPCFVTPSALVIRSSTSQVSTYKPVPFPSIANDSWAHAFDSLPRSRPGGFSSLDDPLPRGFTSPRTIMKLLAAATASQGEILPLRRPSRDSAYALNFFGPAVQCVTANDTTKATIADMLQQEITRLAYGNIREISNGYYAFVPVFNGEKIAAQNSARFETLSTPSNEIWMAFERYAKKSCDHEKVYLVCSLWNATYDLQLAWKDDFQNVTGIRHLSHQVSAPPADAPSSTGEMSGDAYSAFFSALAELLVGSLGWFEMTDGDVSGKRQFRLAQSPIQYTSLLGSPDLDVFFGFNEDGGSGICPTPYANLSAQRRQDVDLARGRTLKEMIEELGFNFTVSLMHNDFLTSKTERMVTEWITVNRYEFKPHLFWIPYGLTYLGILAALIISGEERISTGGKWLEKSYRSMKSRLERCKARLTGIMRKREDTKEARPAIQLKLVPESKPTVSWKEISSDGKLQSHFEDLMPLLHRSAAQVQAVRESRRLAEAASRDHTAMRAIALVTMFFLPGTFFAAIFSIPAFKLGEAVGDDPGTALTVSQKRRIVIAAALGFGFIIGLMSVACFWWSEIRTRRLQEQEDVYVKRVWMEPQIMVAPREIPTRTACVDSVRPKGRSEGMFDNFTAIEQPVT